MQTVTRNHIATALERLPRFRLSHLDTPLEDAPRLRRAIEATIPVAANESRNGKTNSLAPRILIKREDTTGLAFGGNKGRHFEFTTAHILENGYDTVINVNDYHSNQARFIAAACARAGLRYILVSLDNLDEPLTGNLLLCKLMGTEIHRVPADYADKMVDRLKDDLVAEGKKPFVLPREKIVDLSGVYGFVEAGLELEHQLHEIGVTGPVRFWGLGGRSISGVRLYAKNRGLPWSATAVMYSPGAEETFNEIAARRSQGVAERLNLPYALEEGDLDLLTEYTGPAYGVPFDGVFEAMYMAAKSEALILDVNYTGMAMAALIGEIREGRVDPSVPVVFLHTGGLPQVFAFAEEISDFSSSFSSPDLSGD